MSTSRKLAILRYVVAILPAIAFGAVGWQALMTYLAGLLVGGLVGIATALEVRNEHD